jgi:hypothetical protein
MRATTDVTVPALAEADKQAHEQDGYRRYNRASDQNRTKH